jgi:hypothetical protein
MTFFAPRVRWRKFVRSEAAIGKSLGRTAVINKFAPRAAVNLFDKISAKN